MAGVFAVEPVLLLEKGTEEVELVDVSKRFAAAFLVYLAMGPTITARLMLAGQETDSGLFRKPMGRGEKKKQADDEVGLSRVVSNATETRGPSPFRQNPLQATGALIPCRAGHDSVCGRKPAL